ncbi:MAG TPA: thermopsin, partial [Thermoplasmata archaeon]|nr:thermopsin [Thermoplasmata archaeon]
MGRMVGAVAGEPAWHPAIPSGPAPTPLAGSVDPYIPRAGEPAPMGITDFGVAPTPGGYTPYSYATSEWWADANISKLLANDGVNLSGHASVGFQLNVVVKFHSPTAGDVAYWIQDVASVDTISRTIEFVDNIWNMSSTSIYSSSVAGNGSVNNAGGIQWYADAPNCAGLPGGYAGNCVVMQYPTHLTMRVTTGRFGGVPHVTFQYYVPTTGWVTYDNASFPFAAGSTDVGFVVDGTQYTPIGIYYDAEFDYTGPSGGIMYDRSTAMQLQLEFWNGHNLESPPTTFDFGANTAEQISNVRALPLLGVSNGSLASNVTTGPGRLSALYTRANVSILNVTTPTVTQGTLLVGGERHPFVGSEALLTLAPGRYDIALLNSSGVVNSANVTLSPGGYLHVVLGALTPYPVTALERGLPSGSLWTVHLA